jgi:hypothetical protein
MDDAGPFLLPARRAVSEYPVDERARCMARRGMRDHSGRLLDHQQMLVLVRNPETDVLCLEGSWSRRRLELDFLTTRQPDALLGGSAVDEHRAARQYALGCCTRADLGQAGEEAVEPEPGGLARDGSSRR